MTLSVGMIAAGLTLLAVSLAARHHNVWTIAMPASWAGALLVLAGCGKMLFLDGRR